jgi:hypothetical protein
MSAAPNNPSLFITQKSSTQKLHDMMGSTYQVAS